MSDERYGIIYSDKSISVLRPSKGLEDAIFELGEEPAQVVRVRIEILDYIKPTPKPAEPCPTCGARTHKGKNDR